MPHVSILLKGQCMTYCKRIQEFRSLHEADCFVLPNPWDRGSAIMLASLGYKALATSSAALGFVRGVIDSPTTIGLEPTLSNITEIAGATDLPVNADYQAGFGATAEQVATNVHRCIETGVAGLSIEDATGNAAAPLYDADEAVDRVRAARSAIDASGSGVVLTARCESFLVDHPRPLETALERLAAFADEGADCLYAPGLSSPEHVRKVVEAVSPLPVNVLAVDSSWMTVASLTDLGVRRISFGSAMARVAWGALRRSAEDIARSGSFVSLDNSEPFSALNSLFAGHS
jgi:2-methylisocitrate lyase-like PEP mutase family enzyme